MNEQTGQPGGPEIHERVVESREVLSLGAAEAEGFPGAMMEGPPDALPEVAEAVPELPGFSQEELAEGVEASNLRVMWRGGVALEALASVGLSLILNAGVAIVLYVLYQHGLEAERKLAPERGMLVYTYRAPVEEDGGSGGGLMPGGTAKIVDGQVEIAGGTKADGALTSSGNVPSMLAAMPEAEAKSLLAGEENVTPPGVIAAGPRVGPRLLAKRAGGGKVAAADHAGPGSGQNAVGKLAGDGNGGEGYAIKLDDFVKPGMGGSGRGKRHGAGQRCRSGELDGYRRAYPQRAEAGSARIGAARPGAHCTYSEVPGVGAGG